MMIDKIREALKLPPSKEQERTERVLQRADQAIDEAHRIRERVEEELNTRIDVYAGRQVRRGDVPQR